MGEGMDLSWLSSMFGGGGMGGGTDFGSSVGQPQATGVFGGTPQQAGGQFMSGQAPDMVPFYGGGQNVEMPQASGFLQQAGGANAYPNMGAGLLGMAGAMGKPQQHQAQPMMASGGGGGGNVKGLFSALMRQPNLTHQSPAVNLNLGGNNLFGM